jgi:hypothetical protein
MGEMEEVQFGDPLILAEFSIDELRSFYHKAKDHFGLRLAGLEARSKNVSPGDEESDDLAGRMEEVAGLLDLNEHFGVVGVYRTFETFLRNVIHRHRSEGVIKGKKKREKKGKKESYLDRLRNQLKEIGVEPTEPPFQLGEIEKLHTIRNCLAHGDGWVDSEDVSKLRDYTLPVEDGEGSPLRLPSGYFLEASALVASTCKLVIERCAEARRGRG